MFNVSLHHTSIHTFPEEVEQKDDRFNTYCQSSEMYRFYIICNGYYANIGNDVDKTIEVISCLIPSQTPIPVVRYFFDRQFFFAVLCDENDGRYLTVLF